MRVVLTNGAQRRVKVSDYIVGSLYARGVRAVFELAGGMITELLDSLFRDGRIRVVSMHHEQAAAFAAESSARMTGVPGVALATSGPGATNLLTGIASCYFDSTPAVFITGQVRRDELGRGLDVRQLGFQETDIVAMARPVAKAAWFVEEPAEVPRMLAEAFEIAREGRPGPVLLDIPMDVQRAEIDAAPSASAAPACPTPSADLVNEAERVRDLLVSSPRPLVLAGGGVRLAGARAALFSVVRALRIPVVTSLMGLDLVPFDEPMRVGMIGSYGNRWANAVLGSCDTLLVLGSRLDIRQTGADVAAFEDGRTIVQVDVDAGEIGARVKAVRPIVADAGAFLEAMRSLPSEKSPDRAEWLAEIARLRQRWPDVTELEPCSGPNPNVLMHRLSEVARDACAYVVDVGANQMWAGQSLEIGDHQRFLTSGGLGSMGFALPAAVGVATASVSGRVVCISGDGGMQINLQELETVARNGLNIKMLVLNNESLGMVRQFQETYMDGRYQSTVWGYGAPDFERIASAYGIPGSTATHETEIDEALSRWWGIDGPALLQVMLGVETGIAPKMLYGRPMTDMYPPRQRDEND